MPWREITFGVEFRDDLFSGTDRGEKFETRCFRKDPRGDIIRSDPARKIIVASAPGKRFPEDVKVTDLLLRCWEEASCGRPRSLR